MEFLMVSKLFLKCLLYTLFHLLLVNFSRGQSSLNFSLLDSSYNEQSFTTETPKYMWSTLTSGSTSNVTDLPEKNSSTHIILSPSEISSSSVKPDATFPNDLSSTSTPVMSSVNTDISNEESTMGLPSSKLQTFDSSTYRQTSPTTTSSQNFIKPTFSIIKIFNYSTSSLDNEMTSSLLITPTTERVDILKNTSWSTIFEHSYNSVTKQSTESTSTTSLTTTPEIHKTHYFLIFKSDDCPSISTGKLNRELLKTLSSLGVLKVSANITKSECQTSLNVNITVTAPRSAILKLQEGRSKNLTVSIFNRAFQIVDIQQLDMNLKSNESNSTSNTIDVVSRNELKAYVAVGGCLGLVVLVCITVCCLKCFKGGSRKRLGFKNNHTPLTPEDYTLTPIPRPTSLYVDYYRNSSLTGDLYSTTSAGSVGSTSPSGEPGVIQPFDTSIVPLEDTDPLQSHSSSKDNSVYPCSSRQMPTRVPQSVTLDGLIYSNLTSDSTEKLNSVSQGKGVGVRNPIYCQKY